jgi:predicted N-acyltransferase
MRHEKRKKIKQERRKIAEAGITFRLVVGTEATESDWDFFFLCYTRTHILYNSPQAFNRDFFARLAHTMPENLLLVIGEREGTPIAAAFNVFHRGALFGRSWGCTEYVPGLHFETCFYQAIEFCLERGIDIFEGGAQGEHKLSRGLLPVPTWSAHWLAQPEFFRAVEDFLQREGRGMSEYVNELEESSPFKRG